MPICCNTSLEDYAPIVRALDSLQALHGCSQFVMWCRQPAALQLDGLSRKEEPRYAMVQLCQAHAGGLVPTLRLSVRSDLARQSQVQQLLEQFDLDGTGKLEFEG